MNRPILLAALGALAILAAVVLSFVFERDETPPPAPGQPGAQSTQTEATNRPSFDIVRINPKGDAVIAGRAQPGAEVEIRDGDKTIGKVTADARGEWVLVPEQPLSPGAHSLNLVARLNGDTATSDSDVVLVVPEPGRDIAGREGGEAGALALGLPREGGARLLQSPGARAARGKLAIEIIDFDQAGHTTASGQAKTGAEIRLTIDGQADARGRTDANGEWRVTLTKPLAPGRHRLKADQLEGNRVVDSVEVSFERPAAGPESAGSVVVVDAGNSLWRIARRTYGEGTRYTLIFEANRDRIRDPDLIYPGQVFNLPARD
ncbi:MAG: LysM peptidoglycan-binding domain-containing protein [Gemmatimonas sp.]